MSQQQVVGFVGLGAMGVAIASNLLKAGVPLVVYNRSKDKAQSLVDAGATLADSPADAARNATAVISMLADDAATEAVVLGKDGLISTLPKGAVHISMSTISVAMSKKLGAAHEAAGQHFVAAPVLGRPDAAAAAKLFIAVAGAPEALAIAKPLLEKVGQRVTEVGDTADQAHLIKLIANFMIASAIETLGEATALARQGGIDVTAMFDYLTNATFAAPVYKTYAPLIAEEKFEPAGFKLPLGQKDNRLVLEAAQTLGVSLPLAELTRERFAKARELGWDEKDWSAVAALAAGERAK